VLKNRSIGHQASVITREMGAQLTTVDKWVASVNRLLGRNKINPSIEVMGMAANDPVSTLPPADTVATGQKTRVATLSTPSAQNLSPGTTRYRISDIWG